MLTSTPRRSAMNRRGARRRVNADATRADKFARNENLRNRGHRGASAQCRTDFPVDNVRYRPDAGR